MSQTRKQSLIEAWANVLVGYSVSLVSQLVLFPLFGIIIPISTNIKIGIWFTAISLIRSYCLRRFYNWHHRRGDHKELSNANPTCSN